jgi:hypothetical protein
VDGKARGSREEWKWIGSPLTVARLMYKVEIERGKLQCDTKYKVEIEQGKL